MRMMFCEEFGKMKWANEQTVAHDLGEGCQV